MRFSRELVELCSRKLCLGEPPYRAAPDTHLIPMTAKLAFGARRLPLLAEIP
jgi:hypothetical protein